VSAIVIFCGYVVCGHVGMCMGTWAYSMKVCEYIKYVGIYMYSMWIIFIIFYLSLGREEDN